MTRLGTSSRTPMVLVRKQIEVAVRKLGGGHTLTLDNGKEFYDHRPLAKAAGVKVLLLPPVLIDGTRID